MFCPICGHQSPDGLQTCAVCGNALPQYVRQSYVDYQARKNNLRNSEMMALSQAIEYFSHKRAAFDRYDAVCEKINHYARGARSALIVWGSIIAGFSLIYIFMRLFVAPYVAGTWAGVSSVAAVGLLPGILMIVGGILMKVNNRSKYRKFLMLYAEPSQELFDYYVRYPNCPVGPEYVNPAAMLLVLDVLRSGRADTIKEGLNLAVPRTKQEKLDLYLNMIRHNTAAINAQTRVPVVFAPASFFH